MSYPDSDQQALIVKKVVSSIDSKPFYLLAQKRLVQKKGLIKVPLLKSKDSQRISFYATLFLNEDKPVSHYIGLEIAEVWDDFSETYSVKLPIKWKLTKPEDNIITVCMTLRDSLYEFFNTAVQQPLVDDWDYVGAA